MKLKHTMQSTSARERAARIAAICRRCRLLLSTERSR